MIDATLECTCPSGDGSLRWPCPRHADECGTAATPTPQAQAGDAVAGKVTGWLPKQRAVEVMLDEAVPGWLAVQNKPVILRPFDPPQAPARDAGAVAWANPGAFS